MIPWKKTEFCSSLSLENNNIEEIYMKKLIFVIPMFILITDFGSSKSTVSSQSLSGKYLGQEPPVMKAEIFAQGIISTDSFEHSSPNFSPDGNEIYWTQLTAEHGSEAIVKFVTKINGVWSSPQKATFLGGYDDMYPTFSHDGNKIYFSSGRAKENKKEIAKERGIWFIEKAMDGWSEPAYIGFDSLDIYGLSVASNGNIYFMAKRSDTPRLYDLYISEINNGKYNSYEKLKEPINTEHYEDCPFISPDESYLIFESNRPGGYGGTDLYITLNKGNNNWSEPVNLGGEINSSFPERFASLTRDGKYFFFGSDRNGNFDIYWIDTKIINELKDSIPK